MFAVLFNCIDYKMCAASRRLQKVRMNYVASEPCLVCIVLLERRIKFHVNQLLKHFVLVITLISQVNRIKFCKLLSLASDISRSSLE